MNNNSIEKGIKEAIEKIDSIDIKEPDLNWFADLVSDEQLKIAKKQNKQLSIFCALAAVVITFLFSLYNFLFSAFVIMQAISLIVPIIVFIVTKIVSKEARIL
ncbi:DUF5345 family protein [Proteiniborus sp.]|uniref:DUF5345 family protein n=1 Tax=Proteiniborus sp. TaxID=2079015 RepID=UPI0033194A34